MGIGNRIEKKANEKGIRIKKLSEMAGIPYSTLYSICKRDSDRISQDILLKVASALNVDLNWLLHGQTLEDRDNATKESVAVRFTAAELQAKMGKLDSEGLKKVADYVDLLLISGRYDRQPVTVNNTLTVYGDGPAGNFPPKPEEDG